MRFNCGGRATAFVWFAVILGTGCGDVAGPVDPEVNALMVLRGADQRGLVGTSLDTLITFQTAAPNAEPFPATIKVTLMDNGTIRGDGSMVGGAGQSLLFSNVSEASVEWTLGETAGHHRLRAIAYHSGDPATDTLEVYAGASAFPDSVSQNATLLGNNQVAPTGSLLPQRLGIDLHDKYGNAFWGVEVRWIVAGGGGSLSTAQTDTDHRGRAAVEWTLGASVGVQHVEAVIAGLGTVLFTATAR